MKTKQVGVGYIYSLHVESISGAKRLTPMAHHRLKALLAKQTI